MARTQLAIDKDVCDEIFSRMIRRPGRCHRCGSTERLQCAHIVSRKYGQTRCDFRNAICLCAGCHMWFTINPLKWAEYVLASVHDQATVDELHRLAHDPSFKAGKAFWRDMRVTLKALEQAA